MYSFSKVCRTATWGLIPTGRDSCWKWNGSMIFQTIAWFCFQTNRPFVDVFWSKQTDANHRLGIYVFRDSINFIAFLGYLFPFFPSMSRIMYVVHPGCMWRSTCLGDNSLNRRFTLLIFRVHEVILPKLGDWQWIHRWLGAIVGWCRCA